MSNGQEQPLGADMLETMTAQSFADDDRRAENNLRTVFFEPERIVILRIVAGISMRIVVPICKFADVRLKIRFAPVELVYNVILRHTDPDLCVTLFESGDDDLALAALSEWANFFGLPKFEDVSGRAPNDDTSPEDTQCTELEKPAGILGGMPIARRRGGTLAKRRPRLFARRHVGSLERAKIVFRKDREIIARD